MSIKAAIHHLTHYSYDQPVVLGPAGHPPRPAPAFSRTRVISHSLKVEPRTALRELPAGPLRQLAGPVSVFRAGDASSRSRSISSARHDSLQPVRFLRARRARTNWPFEYPPEIADDLAIYRTTEQTGTASRKSFLDGHSEGEAANGRLHRDA